MTTRRYFVMALGIALLALPSLAADSPFVGTWKFNAAKSKFSAGAPSLKSATVKAEMDGAKLKTSVDGVDGEGKVLKYVVSALLDGTAAPVTGNPNVDSTEVKRVDDHTMTVVAKKAGKVVYNDKRVVSKNGKTLTATREGTTAAGQKYTATIVLDKQ